MKPGKSGLTRIIEATGHSIRGLRACWHHEEAFRQDVIISLILLALSFFVAESPATMARADRTAISDCDR